MNRRDFLVAGASAAVLPALPAPIASGEPVGVAWVPLERMKAFAVGTTGNFDWASIFAENDAQAIGIYAKEREISNDEAADLSVKRVALWDKYAGLESEEGVVSGADWIRVGFGTSCSECWDEVVSDCDCHIVPTTDEVKCSECMTLSDWQVTDPEYYAEQIDELLTDEYGPDLRFPEWW